MVSSETDPLMTFPQAFRDKQKEQLKRNTRCLWILGVLSVTLLAITFVNIFALPKIVMGKIKDQTVVDSPHAQGYQTWAGYDVPDIFYEMTFWNVTNPKEAASGKEKVKVEEIGPYVFKEYRIKHNVTFSEDGNVVEYFQWQYYVFDEERSAPGLRVNDTFVTGNVAYQGVVNSAQLDILKGPIPEFFKLDKKLLKGLLCEAWEKDGVGYHDPALDYTPFVRVPITDYFFGMKNEPVMATLSKWIDDTDKKFSALGIKLDRVTTDFPGLGPLNFTDMNDTLIRSSPNVQYTGKNDTSLTGKYLKWQNMTDVYVCPLPPPRTGENLVYCPGFQTEWTEEQANKNGWVKMWKTEEALKVQGTDMVHWPLDLADKELLGFVDPLYRWAKVEAQWDEIKTLDLNLNVPAMKFAPRPQDLLNATMYPFNDAYYDYGPEGLLNMTFKAGLPFFTSKPHFLDCDERLINGVEGMKPNREKHDTWIMKNQLLGQTINAHQAVQLSVLIPDNDLTVDEQCSPIELLNVFPCCTATQSQEWDGTWTLKKTTPEGVYLPIVHILEHFVITNDEAKQIKFAELMHNQVPKYTPYIGFPLVGVLLLAMALLYRQRQNILQSEPQCYTEEVVIEDKEREPLIKPLIA